MEMSWGLLGPGSVTGERRSRTLDLGAVVRRYNDLAVPGIGGVWFGKQLLLAAAGVRLAGLAQAAGVQVNTVECANAVEALGCWLGFSQLGWARDRRLRGREKLPREHGLDFKAVRKKSFYVVQPMRMATVLAMQPLGIVQPSSRRFNTFVLTEEGEAFVDAAFRGFAPYGGTVMAHLDQWAQGKQDGRMQTQALRGALSACAPLPEEARKLLMNQLQCGGSAESTADKLRRRAALAWVDAVRAQPSRMDWDRQPPQISDVHWADMRAGAALFATRDTGIEVLDALEREVARMPGEHWHLQDSVPPLLRTPLSELKQQAAAFLGLKHHDPEANTFCGECAQDSAAKVLKCLVQRDGRVLRLIGDEVRPGSAFRRQPNLEAADDEGAPGETPAQPDSGDLQWPPHISHRVRNLYILNLDLHGELDAWLAADVSEGEQA